MLSAPQLDEVDPLPMFRDTAIIGCNPNTTCSSEGHSNEVRQDMLFPVDLPGDDVCIIIYVHLYVCFMP